MVYTPTQIRELNISSSKDGAIWKPARGINHTVESLSSKIKNAFFVLIGRYDALDWEGH